MGESVSSNTTGACALLSVDTADDGQRFSKARPIFWCIVMQIGHIVEGTL